MKTWINVDYILEASKETKFLQELVLARNFDMVKAIESTTCLRAYNFTERKVLNFINHNKSKDNYIFKIGLHDTNPEDIVIDKDKLIYFYSKHVYQDLANIYHRDKSYKTNKIFIYHNYDWGKRYYAFDKNKLLKPLNLFSVGLYRVYKNKIYKAIDSHDKHLKNLDKYARKLNS